MTIETRIYSEMLYSLAGDIDSDEGCFMESAETLREAAQRLDEQTVTIRSIEKQRDDLLAALEEALPMVPCGSFDAEKLGELAAGGHQTAAMILRHRAAIASAKGNTRCPLCRYQHGHAIGCANNPVDQTLASVKGGAA